MTTDEDSAGEEVEVDALRTVGASPVLCVGWMEMRWSFFDTSLSLNGRFSFNPFFARPLTMRELFDQKDGTQKVGAWCKGELGAL